MPFDAGELAFDATEHPHRRFDPLRGEWVLVSPHRTRRPWQGQIETPSLAEAPAYEPSCYLCPGNARAGGHRNPEYEHTFVFTNDFAALLEEAPEPPAASPGALIRAEGARGTCRVVCFSPRHDLSLARLPAGQLERVVDLWAAQSRELGATYDWVQVFENRGPMMGASNPHPHGQIWATATLPTIAAREDRRQRAYARERGRPLLLDYAEEERRRGERVIVENEHWLALVPYWAVWPFELMLLPLRHVARIDDLGGGERSSLADLVRRTFTRLDNLFRTPFPYSFGWHGAPYGGAGDAGATAAWQLHAHVYPPLLRSASVRKFLVGFELLAEPQRDITPEQAARRLQAASEAHYADADPSTSTEPPAGGSTAAA